MTMHIVLDTNAIVSEGFGNSRQFKALLSVSNSLGYTIVVPQIVIDETVARFSKSLASEVESVRNKLRKLSNWMDRVWIHLLGRSTWYMKPNHSNANCRESSKMPMSLSLVILIRPTRHWWGGPLRALGLLMIPDQGTETL